MSPVFKREGRFSGDEEVAGPRLPRPALGIRSSPEPSQAHPNIFEPAANRLNATLSKMLADRRRPFPSSTLLQTR